MLTRFLVLDHFRYFSILVLVNLILSMLRIERQNLRLVYSLHKSRKLSNTEGPPWKTEQLNGTILYETSYMTHSCLNFSLLFACSYKFTSKHRLFLIFLFNSYERNNYYHKTVFESTCDLKIVNSTPIIPSFSLKRLGYLQQNSSSYFTQKKRNNQQCKQAWEKKTRKTFIVTNTNRLQQN